MQLKRIDPSILVYHYFEKSPTEFSLFDDELDMPIMYGSKNLVDATVRKLAVTVKVIYYKRDTTEKYAFKKKVVYTGKRDDSNTKKG